MVHSCQSRTWEFKSGGSRVHAHPQLTVKYKPAWYICIIRKIKQQQKNWKIVVAKNVTFGIEFYVMWPNIYIGSLPLYKTGVAAFSFNPSTLRWVGDTRSSVSSSATQGVPGQHRKHGDLSQNKINNKEFLLLWYWMPHINKC